MTKSPTQRAIPAIVAILVIAAVGSLNAPRYAGAESQTPRWYDQWRTRPSFAITGTTWDFYKKSTRDMASGPAESQPNLGKGEYIDIMTSSLDPHGKPVFAGGGYKVDSPWTDARGTPIIWPKKYIAKWPGDRAGESHARKDKAQGLAVTPDEDVQHWWRDDDSSNDRYDAPITFVRSPGSSAGSIYPEGVYVSDAVITRGAAKSAHQSTIQEDPPAALSQGQLKKNRYTWEGDTTFVYEKGSSWWLTVSTPDDVWVYIDDRLVIDLGGAFKAGEKRPTGFQTINLDRLEWLTDGATYSLKIFMADRDSLSDASHLKIVTSIQTLNLVGPPVHAQSN